MRGRIYGIGVGTGDPEDITLKAIRLIKKKGISTEYGAREIDRLIRNEIKPLFVDDILFGKLKNGGKLKLSEKDNEFITKIKGQ